MLISLLLAAPAIAAPMALPPAPACRPAQLRLTFDTRDGDFNGMSHSGTALSIRNVGRDCTLPALPILSFRDTHGRALPVARRAPIGMHPGPVMIPLRLAAGHRAEAELRWVSGAVYPHNRSVRAASLAIHIGGGTLRAPIKAVLYGEAGRTVMIEQTPLRAAEGMAAG